MTRRRVDVSRPRPRRGATLVLVTVCLTVLALLAGLVLDVARLSTVAAQLKTLTDAAALSAITDLRRLEPNEATADARALALRANNPVEGQVLADTGMNATDVEPGRWDFVARQFTPLPWAQANAVRVTARATMAYSFMRLVVPDGQQVTRRSIAALASPLRSLCLKPWAVPYSNLLVSLGRLSTDTAYRLTAADVATLRDNRIPVTFKVAAAGTVGGRAISGNYYAVRYPPIQLADGTPGSPVGGATVYRAAIADTTCATTGTAAVGDWLDIENGNMTGPTLQGVQQLCNRTGANFSCNAAIAIPIWSTQASRPGGTWVQVLYLGAFQLTNVANGEVSGYLTALAAPRAGGGYTPFPGPLTIATLVE
jgi:hypothetical protein